MRPTLSPGDGLLTLRDDNPRRGQLRVFRDPTKSSRWLVNVSAMSIAENGA